MYSTNEHPLPLCVRVRARVCVCVCVCICVCLCSCIFLCQHLVRKSGQIIVRQIILEFFLIEHVQKFPLVFVCGGM